MDCVRGVAVIEMPDDQTLVVASSMADNYQGTVYVYTRGTATTDQFVLAQTLSGASLASGEAMFGSSVSVSGDTMLIGAPSTNHGGLVAAYDRSGVGSPYTLTETLLVPFAPTDAEFGCVQLRMAVWHHCMRWLSAVDRSCVVCNRRMSLHRSQVAVAQVQGGVSVAAITARQGLLDYYLDGAARMTLSARVFTAQRTDADTMLHTCCHVHVRSRRVPAGERRQHLHASINRRCTVAATISGCVRQVGPRP